MSLILFFGIFSFVLFEPIWRNYFHRHPAFVLLALDLPNYPLRNLKTQEDLLYQPKSLIMSRAFNESQLTSYLHRKVPTLDISIIIQGLTPLFTIASELPCRNCHDILTLFGLSTVLSTIESSLSLQERTNDPKSHQSNRVLRHPLITSYFYFPLLLEQIIIQMILDWVHM